MAWKNENAWMEKQEGSRWNSLLEKENAKFTDAIQPLKSKISRFNGLMKSRSSPTHYKGWSIESAVFGPEHIWTHGKFKIKCWDADLSSDMFVAAVQSPEGYERFTVEVYSLAKDGNLVHLKTLQKTGPTVAILDQYILYLSSKEDLRYSSVKVWSPSTEEATLYTTNNLEENLELIRGEDSSVYCKLTDFSKTRFGRIEKSKVYWDTPSIESGIPHDDLKLPGLPKDTIESFSLKAGWAVTRSRGIRTLWNLSKPPKAMIFVWGDISSDSRDPFTLHASDIRYESYTVKVPKWILTNPKPHEFPCSYYQHPLPAFVVYPIQTIKPKGLLITAYGAYGTPTHVGSFMKRWKPLLLEGWICASVMVQGSGDDNVEWRRAGQRENRKDSIDSLHDSIESLQEELGIPPEKTALYGRSAGGLLVSSVALLYPGLVGALYLESPYLDILRTITNPDLPLTTLETHEFGFIENPTNILATGSWSPMEHIPVEGIPELFVIARTDTADLEVFPYEVIKFIHKVRGNGKGQKKLLFIDEGLGHFTTSVKSRSEDLALLDSWLDFPDPDAPGQEVQLKNYAVRTKNHMTKYKMPPSRKNRATRKNRKDRKDSRKNRNNVTMGGRRRRSHSRRHSKKH